MVKDGTFMIGRADLPRVVDDIVAATPVVDMHTHLFPPQFGPLSLRGIDDLLVYPSLVAELFRFSNMRPQEFWTLTKSARADLVWQTLFVRRTPLSEAARGIVAVFSALGLDVRATDLSAARAFFRAQPHGTYMNRILDLAHVSHIVMTNDPFDAVERQIWESGTTVDPRFSAALRIDRLLDDWPSACRLLREQGYDLDIAQRAAAVSEVARFLERWVERMRPLYLAASLPCDFTAADESHRAWLIREVVLPVCRQNGLPLMLMIGVRRQVNPVLREAGDGMGYANMQVVEQLCAAHPDVRFLVTMLSRENQHELCVVASTFSNLLPFGCWWFLNNPSIMSDITRQRLEMLGTSFVPQHSDARVLEQLVYKWKHARRAVSEALTDGYCRLINDGGVVTVADIAKDTADLLSGNFCAWVGLRAPSAQPSPQKDA